MKKVISQMAKGCCCSDAHDIPIKDQIWLCYEEIQKLWFCFS